MKEDLSTTQMASADSLPPLKPFLSTVYSQFEPFHLTELLAIQSELNQAIVPDWEQKGLDFSLAAILETGEALDCLPWKWWKETQYNKQNLVIEMIDILHFLFSLALSERDQFWQDPTAAIWRAFKYPPTSLVPATRDQEIINVREALLELIYFLTQYRLNKYVPSLEKAFELWLQAWTALGQTLLQIRTYYLAKEAINRFRQQNGYKDGTYHKELLIPSAFVGNWDFCIFVDEPIEDALFRLELEIRQQLEQPKPDLCVMDDSGVAKILVEVAPAHPEIRDFIYGGFELIYKLCPEADE
jgi:dimeric dUTPase (all-alpha-NTP-PPase superfamily)